MFLRIFVNKRAAADGKSFQACRQGHRAHYFSTGAFGGFHNALGRLVKYTMIVSFEADANLLAGLGLFHHFSDDTRADGQTAFANGKALASFERHTRDQLHIHVDIVARHDHLHPRR